ncbi:MAG: indolepyruvate oxidoreductase, partial [Chloroflexi bacterium]|nr:indolepyruvate oxidoreductase [Chloroflexota bacterium]
MDTEILLGNDAIALALVEHNCRMVTGYPGTPSSEILAGVVKYKKQLGRQVYTEWSTNEKVAMEVALAAAWSGLRAAVTMKQVGLNVASDPLFSATYSGVKGGFVIIVADDPGPQSSQTEQDSRMMALNAKVPVFDPSSPAEARDMIGHAMQLSEKYGIPVILRPTTRICHAVQSMTVSDKTITDDNIPPVKFRKDPQRWAATPRYRYTLHVELNRKLQDIETDFAKSSLNYVADPDDNAKIGIIASGVAFHTARQTLVDLGIQAPILKIGTPFPLPQKLVTQFTQKFKTVVVLEESDTCIELQLPQRGNVRGRLDGTVPSAGELTPEVVFDILADIFTTANHAVSLSPDYTALQTLVESIPMPVRRPRLCPGCSHRSVYFSLKREFGPKAIYPGDIGCYTLGTNLRMVDTVVDMGASISMAHGFYQTNRLVKDKRPIIATIGDST